MASENIYEEEVFHMVALSFVEGVGAKTAKKLLEHFDNAKSIFNYFKEERTALNIESASIKKALESKAAFLMAEREIAYAEKNNIKVLILNGDDYPKRLANCHDAPLVLYYKGQQILNSLKMVSIVGSRNATSYGRNICRDFIKEMKAFNPVIISGIAYGIDAYAHQEALNNNLPTVAVLGHGLDMIYPNSHSRMANEMLQTGGLLTEFPSRTIPDRFNFPMRNRIIAGLADVTIVVEAAKRGGALITAECANSYHRDVCAFPGNIYQEYSEGCNYLIKTNRAFPISNVEDLEYLMGWQPVEKGFKPIKQKKVSCNSEEKKVLEFLHKNGPANIDKLIEVTTIPVSALSLMLLQMELKDLIVPLPGKVYMKK